MNSYPLVVRKQGIRRIFIPLGTATKPRFCTPQISGQDQPQTLNISEQPRRVSPTHGQGHLTASFAEINPKMPSFSSKASPRTINSNKDAAPRWHLSSTCSSGRRTACHNLALASLLRWTKSPYIYSMEHILQRRPHQPLHRRLRLSTR